MKKEITKVGSIVAKTIGAGIILVGGNLLALKGQEKSKEIYETLKNIKKQSWFLNFVSLFYYLTKERRIKKWMKWLKQLLTKESI